MATARPDFPDCMRSVPKRVRLVVYQTQIPPNDHDIKTYQVRDLISQGVRTVDKASSDRPIPDLGTIKTYIQSNLY